MKRLFTTLLIALAATTMMAQMQIWYNGAIVYQRAYNMIDSITFSLTNINPPTPSEDNLQGKWITSQQQLAEFPGDNENNDCWEYKVWCDGTVIGTEYIWNTEALIQYMIKQSMDGEIKAYGEVRKKYMYTKVEEPTEAACESRVWEGAVCLLETISWTDSLGHQQSQSEYCWIPEANMQERHNYYMSVTKAAEEARGKINFKHEWARTEFTDRDACWANNPQDTTIIPPTTPTDTTKSCWEVTISIMGVTQTNYVWSTQEDVEAIVHSLRQAGGTATVTKTSDADEDACYSHNQGDTTVVPPILPDTNGIEISIDSAIAICKSMSPNAETEVMYKLSGVISKNTTNPMSVPLSYDNINFDLTDSTGTISCYYTNNLLNKPFRKNSEVPRVGSKVTVIGVLTLYQKAGTTTTTPELKNGYLVRIDSMVAPPPFPGCPEPEEGQISASEAATLALSLNDGAVSKEAYDILGVVTEVLEFNSGKATYIISSDGSRFFEVYRGVGMNNEAFPYKDYIQPNDTVVVHSKLTNYKGMPETSGTAGLVSTTNPNYAN